MGERLIQITDTSVVLKAAEAVWAMNKYFILACSQKHYQEIREHFRAGVDHLNDAYHLFTEIEETYADVPSSDLPQITNALYHMAGYFKRDLSSEERQAMNNLIESDPAQALSDLEKLSVQHEVTYLLQTRLFRYQREKPFNAIPISIRYQGEAYKPYTLKWKGDRLESFVR